MGEVARDFGGSASAVRASEDRLMGNFANISSASPQIHNFGAVPDKQGLGDLHDDQLSGSPPELAPPEVSEPSETQVALAKVLHLPAPEPIEGSVNSDGSPEALPATTLDLEHVKSILLSVEYKNIHERIQILLTYAWNSTSYIERTLPADIRAYAADNLADWYKAHQEEIDSKISERTEIQGIYDETEPYESAPFMRNIEDIRSMAWNRGLRDESIRLGLSARMIVLEAIRDRKYKTRNS